MGTALDNPVIGGRYELKEHLATGGMALVYRGWDVRLRRPVAVKCLRDLENADESVIARFRREARAAAALQHPNIVEVYDFFEEGGCYYLVMELVDGPNLKQHLSAHGPMRPDEALRIAMQICGALEAAHECGFIHRDIKPQNILLAPTGEAKLADFGIVHIPRDTAFTSSGTVFGTADYISPEQAQGLRLGPTTDVYSLGVVLYEMLTGALPFTGTTPMAVAVQHATAPVPALHLVYASVPPCVERVVMRALRKDPRERYPSAPALCAALDRAARDLRAQEQPSETPDAGNETTSESAPAWRVVAEQLLKPAGSGVSDVWTELDVLDAGDEGGDLALRYDSSEAPTFSLSLTRLAMLVCVAALLLLATLALQALL